jgi:hypothetical protein
LRAEGFFCNLDILGGLGIGKLQFLIKKKNLIFFSAVIFFPFLVFTALDPDPDPDWSPASNAGSGSGKN